MLNFKKIFLMTLAFGLMGLQAFGKDNLEREGSYKIIVNGYDWGPAVNKVIVSLNDKISDINKTTFSVTETKKWYSEKATETFNREVTDAYLSDEKGNKINAKASKYFVLEMAVSPSEGSPFLYNIKTGMNDWTNPYFLTIKLAEDKKLFLGKKEIKSFKVDTKVKGKIMPEVDKFKMSEFTSDNITLKYAYYSPKKDLEKNPLVIWLHGMGEGGIDPTIALLGNKVTALVSDETQNLLKNAYVLVPQAPTFWMDNGSGDISKFNGVSKYDKSLFDLINAFVNANPDIDKTKIIIGGCSNGGYMTMRTVILHPDYFSAAYPICEAYFDNLITDEMLVGIKDLPIWFTHAKNDPVVNPQMTVVPTYNRLSKINKNVHLSFFEDVKDTSGIYKDVNGNPYEYNGHWSWIHTLNNESSENGIQLFEWAVSQKNIKQENN